MNKLEYLESIFELFVNPKKESLDLSLRDTHHNGIFSLVVGGTEFGRLIRVFIADEVLKPYEVQLHTHRYPIRLTVLKGEIEHYTAVIPTKCTMADLINLSKFEYRSPLNGGNGLKYMNETQVIINQTKLPVGSTINMTSDEFHTMSCSRGSMWIVEELGFEKESSYVSGTPFVTDGLYNPPTMFQINDKFQLVKKEIQKIILDYKTVL